MSVIVYTSRGIRFLLSVNVYTVTLRGIQLHLFGIVYAHREIQLPLCVIVHTLRGILLHLFDISIYPG
jgi:hypothetical protein